MMDKAWWLWVSWAEAADGQRKFIYGCMAQTHADEPIEQSNGECDGVHFCQKIITSEEAERFSKDLMNGNKGQVVSFPFLKEAPDLNIKARKSVKKDVLGQKNVSSDIYYTMPRIEDIFGMSVQDPFKNALNVLEGELGFPFSKEFIRYFGSFEVFQLHPWLDDPTPYLLDVDRSVLGKRETFFIYRDAEYAKKQHDVHVQFKANDEVVAEKLIHLGHNKTRSKPIYLPNSADTYNCSVFENGLLVHRDEGRYFRQIKISVRNANEKTEHDKRESLTEKYRMVGNDLHRYEDYLASVFGKTPEIKKDDLEDRFFLTNRDDGAAAIKHLKSMITSEKAAEIIIFDPYFNLQAYEKIQGVFKLMQRNARVTVITSLQKAVENKEEKEGENKKESKGNLFEPLWERLDGEHQYLEKTLILKNCKKQAFHDRFIVIKPAQEEMKIYSLSNSLNSISNKYPFYIHEVSGRSYSEIAKYLNELKEGRDTNGIKENLITDEWPSKPDDNDLVTGMRPL